MSNSLIARLQTVEVMTPQEAGGLQVFGLRWLAGSPLQYATLDEGLASGQIEVTEVSDGGSVPTLKVANKGDTMAFLMAGEQLAGGKQNRVLNASILVAANSELPIPVSCVERGRWSYRGPHFGSTGTSSHSELRRMMHAQTTRSYKTAGTPTSDQSAVWQEVDRKLGETQSFSGTQYLDKAYEDSRPQLDETVKNLTPPESAHGAVFAYGGKVVGFDLFDQPLTLTRLWPKLVRAYVIDARMAPTEGVQPVTADAVRDWLRSAAGATEQQFKSPGLGDDVRVEAPTLTGAALLVEDHPVHVEAFAV